MTHLKVIYFISLLYVSYIPRTWNSHATWRDSRALHLCPTSVHIDSLLKRHKSRLSLSYRPKAADGVIWSICHRKRNSAYTQWQQQKKNIKFSKNLNRQILQKTMHKEGEKMWDFSKGKHDLKLKPLVWEDLKINIRRPTKYLSVLSFFVYFAQLHIYYDKATPGNKKWSVFHTLKTKHREREWK